MSVRIKIKKLDKKLMAAEFSSKEKCEAAGKTAADKFGGLTSRPYWVCVQK